MDAKALAKSKRAHSLAKSKKPHRPLITPRSTPISLPSNWERYEDEEQDIASGTVLPKSKGADYRHLLEESRSHAYPSFDDELLDAFTGGISEKMFTVKGERITTWIENDNFNVDEDSDSTNFDVPLLSLNLRALSDQLTKVNISCRLYIESDFSSSETESTAPEESENEKDDKLIDLNNLGEIADQSGSGSLKIKSAEEESSQSSNRNVADTSTGESKLDELMSSFEGTDIASSFKNKFTMKENQTDTLVGSTEKNLSKHPIFDSSSADTSRTSPSQYGGFAALSSQDFEAELDALLSSPNDTTNNNLKGSELREHFGKGLQQNDNSSSRKQKMKADVAEASLSSRDKSKMLDDFDSWMDSL